MKPTKVVHVALANAIGGEEEGKKCICVGIFQLTNQFDVTNSNKSRNFAVELVIIIRACMVI